MKEKTIQEKCENCGKRITKKMKANQQVIYAGAEHTLSDGEFDFCDLMFGGIYCCQDCYEEQAGIKIAYKKGFNDCLAEVEKKIDDFETSFMMKLGDIVGNKILREDYQKLIKMFDELKKSIRGEK